VSGIRQRQAGRRHDQCADQEEATQIVAGREQAHRQRHDRRSKQRNRGNNPDLKWAEADFGQVGRQNDDGESVAEAAGRPRCVQQSDLRSPSQRWFFHLVGYQHHSRSIGRRHGKVGEVHAAVGFGPEPDATGDRLRQLMFEI
jgi:hypothetical protein